MPILYNKLFIWKNFNIYSKNSFSCNLSTLISEVKIQESNKSLNLKRITKKEEKNQIRVFKLRKQLIKQTKWIQSKSNVEFKKYTYSQLIYNLRNIQKSKSKFYLSSKLRKKFYLTKFYNSRWNYQLKKALINNLKKEIKIKEYKKVSNISYSKYNNSFYYFQTIKGFNGQNSNFNNQFLLSSKKINYQFNNIKGTNFSLNIGTLIKNLFYTIPSLISTPIYTISPNSLNIKLFLFTPGKKTFISKKRKNNKPFLHNNFKNEYWNNISKLRFLNYNNLFEFNSNRFEPIFKPVLSYTVSGNPLLNQIKKENYNLNYILNPNYELYPYYIQLLISNIYLSFSIKNNTIFPILSKKGLRNENKVNYAKIRKLSWWKRVIALSYIHSQKRINYRYRNLTLYRNKYKKVFSLINKINSFLFKSKSVKFYLKFRSWNSFKLRYLKNKKRFRRANKKSIKGLRIKPLKLITFKNWPLTSLLSKIIIQNKKNYNISSYLDIQNLDIKKLNTNKLISSNIVKKIVKKIKIKKTIIKNLKKNAKNKLYTKKANIYNSFFILYKKRLENITRVLSYILNKNVNLEITRLSSPFKDSNMISQVLGINSKTLYFYKMWRLLLPKLKIQNPTQNIKYMLNKKEEEMERKENISLYSQTSYLPSLFNLTKLNSKFINYRNISKNNILSSYISGINMRLAGRLMTQKMRPRFTVQMKQNGSLAKVKVDYIEKSRFTSKNKRGAFSFTIAIGHILK